MAHEGRDKTGHSYVLGSNKAALSDVWMKVIEYHKEITTYRQAKIIAPGVKASILTTKTKKITYCAKKIHPPIQTNTYQATSHRNHTNKPENSTM